MEDSESDSGTMESLESSELRIEVDKADDSSGQWVVTDNMQEDTDSEESDHQQVHIENPVFSQRIREEAHKIAQAFYAYQACQNGTKKRARVSSGRRPGRPWTHSSLKVICLDVRPRGELGRAPSAQQIAELTALGLGVPSQANQKGVCYFKNSESASKFQRCLQQLFPRLIPGEYCCSIASKGSSLSEIHGFEVMTVEQTKKFLNQGRLYIVPFALRDLEEVGYKRPAVSPLLGILGPQEPSLPTSVPHPAFRTGPGSEESLLKASESPSQIPAEPVVWTRLEPSSPASSQSAQCRSQEQARQTTAESQFRTVSRPALVTASQPSHQPSVPMGVHDARQTPPARAVQLECTSFDDMVLKLRPSPPDNHKILLNIRRDTFLQDARRGFFRPGVDLRRPTHVKFVGSSDIDNGGLSAHFRSELVRHLRDCCVFAGPENSKSLVYSYFCVEEEMYRHVGVMLAYVIAHGGPYPAFFSSKLYSLLLDEETDFAVEDVQDPTLRRQLEQLQAAENPEETEAALKELSGVLAITGLQPARMQKKQLLLCLVDFLCNQLMYIPLTQLREGLSELGVLPIIKRNPELGRPFLLAHLQPSVSVEALRDLWTCDIDGSSAAGREEIRIHGYFLDLLLDLDENQRRRLLKFATGQDSIPAEGFRPQPRLTFNHSDTILTADMDSLELGLPVTASAHSFNTALLAALHWDCDDPTQD